MLNPLCLQRPFNSPTERAKRTAEKEAKKEAYKKYASRHKDEVWFQEEVAKEVAFWQHLND